MRNKFILIWISLVLLFSLTVLYYIFYAKTFFTINESSYKFISQEIKPLIYNGPTVMIGETRIPITLATTTADVERGLSGQISLPPNSGKLFIFQSEDIYQFWMPDMHFSIDIIWIDAKKRIVDISKNVPPLSDFTNPVFYKPSSPVKYVLEVNANFSDTYNISKGDQVQFLFMQYANNYSGK